MVNPSGFAQRTGVMLAVICLVSLVAVSPGAAEPTCTYWVAPEPLGDDQNSGTAADPWATMRHAVEHVPDAGCTVIFAPGVYGDASRVTRRFSEPATFRSAEPYKAVLEADRTVLHLSGARHITIEGFELRHASSAAEGYVAIVDRKQETWAEHIIFRDNVFHDSYENDLLKIHNGVRHATVSGNVFYNQGDSEHHLDVNSVTDVVLEDNIHFNDFAASGRVDTRTTKDYVIVKDSNGGADGLFGSERVTVRRNVFLHWQGGQESLVKVGNDGKAYHEAKEVKVENNLFIGDSGTLADSAFGVRGAKDVWFVNNTIVGDFPSKAYAYRIHLKGENPINENIVFANNIWSDPSGTMAHDDVGVLRNFARNEVHEVDGLLHHNNLYWNGGKPIPTGRAITPMMDDEKRLIRDPRLADDHADIELPYWDGTGFPSGNRTIREEFVRLVETYAMIPPTSPAVGTADPSFAPQEDIRGRRRVNPDVGAYEAVAGVPPAAAGPSSSTSVARSVLSSLFVLILSAVALHSQGRGRRSRLPTTHSALLDVHEFTERQGGRG
jgi:hypothetical protein